jgi:hypothetical protein
MSEIIEGCISTLPEIKEDGRFHFSIYTESKPDISCITSSVYHNSGLAPVIKAEDLKLGENVVLIGAWLAGEIIFSVDQIRHGTKPPLE